MEATKKKPKNPTATAKRRKAGVLIYDDYAHFFEKLPPLQCKQLILAVLGYNKSAPPPELDLPTQMAFDQIKITMDKDQHKYDAKCAKNSENVKKRWANNKIIPNDTNVYERIPSDTNAYEAIPSDTKHTDKDKDKGKDTKETLYRKYAERFKQRLIEDNPDEVGTVNRNWGSNGDAWCDSIRLLVDRDGYELETIGKVMKFIVEDEFWCDKVRSLGGIRKKTGSGSSKFDNIYTKYLAKGKKPTIDPLPTTDQYASNRKKNEAIFDR